VVHRDIKPDNLFVVRDGNGWRTLKIFDFGISKVSLTGKYSDVDLAGRNTELIMGTPHYISPEQIRSTRDVDHRTDIWSLGVVMFEVLSGGVLPFRENREMTALIAEVLEEPHRSLLDVAPNVPEALASIVDRCLVKDREQRYQTTAEVALDLLPFCPARARASAERAVAAMQVAGLIPINADMASFRPSQTPLADLRNARTLSPGQTPASARRANISQAPANVGRKPEPGQHWSRPRILALLGLFALIVIAALFAFSGAHDAPRAAPSAARSAEAPGAAIERAASPATPLPAAESAKPVSSAGSARTVLPPHAGAPAFAAPPRHPAAGVAPPRPAPPEPAPSSPPRPAFPATRLDVIRER
jgi:serine/threonine-protein kinase